MFKCYTDIILFFLRESCIVALGNSSPADYYRGLLSFKESPEYIVRARNDLSVVLRCLDG